jgi:hypothetical protein
MIPASPDHPGKMPIVGRSRFMGIRYSLPTFYQEDALQKNTSTGAPLKTLKAFIERRDSSLARYHRDDKTKPFGVYDPDGSPMLGTEV